MSESHLWSEAFSPVSSRFLLCSVVFVVHVCELLIVFVAVFGILFVRFFKIPIMSSVLLVTVILLSSYLLYNVLCQ